VLVLVVVLVVVLVLVQLQGVETRGRASLERSISITST